MKTGNVFWGVLLVVLGALFLLNNLNIVSICLGDLWKFWPLLLVFWGIAALVKDKRATWVVAAVVAVFLALIVFSVFSFRWSGCGWDEGGGGPVETQLLSEPYNPAITRASLEISAGAARVVIDGTSDQLLEAETRSSLGECTLSSFGEGDSRELTLAIPGSSHGFRLGKVRNEASVRLNQAPTWEVSLGVGATSADLDLRPFSVKRVEINAGATSVRVSLGVPKEETEVHIEAGASSITIDVPSEAACAISVDAALSSKDFDGFQKVSSGRYETEDFDEQMAAIRITIEAGVSSVRVRRI